MKRDLSFYKQVLLEQQYITDEDAVAAEAYEKTGEGTFVDYLLKQEVVNNDTLGLAIAEHYKTVFIDLDARMPSNEDIARIPEDIARAHRVVFAKEEPKSVTVASDSPDAVGLVKKVQPLFPKKKIIVAFAFEKDIDAVLAHYQKELATRFSEIIEKQGRVAPEIFDEIIADAISYRASDIHFEPQQTKALVRFRVDGMLRLAGSVPREYYDNIVNRIKIQSNLRTDEHFAPQDGAIRFTYGEKTVDLRVSIVPLLDGEKIVIRILAEYVQGLNFSDLGFSDAHVDVIEKAAQKPFGMIVVTGPTGSGKTTSLYSLIRRLNTPENNVTTIEDPVEYRIAGANQIQVNQKTGLTFAKGLRAIVRQDPNIILVGEIRDTETAETAINAALTGHLLLSTFHANDAATTIPRLLDMELEPFLLSSTLELIVAQRLVRRLCESCRYSYTEKLSEFKKTLPAIKNHFSGTQATLFRGKGCSVCNGTGYRGRTSIVEMIEVTPLIKQAIADRVSADEIWKRAASEGARSMFDDGIEKAKAGMTSIEEVFRVATPPKI